MYILILSFLFFRGISATCYRPDYALQTNPVFMACDSRQGQISSCCALNRTSDTGPVPRDICLPNGLCQNIATISGQTQVTYWRGSCSDNSWPKEDCLMGVCMGASENGPSFAAQVTPCDNTTTSSGWCCGANNTACCGTDQEIKLAATIGLPIPSNTSQPSASQAITSQSASSTLLTSTPTTPVPQVTATGTSNISENVSLPAGAKVAIGIGATTAVLLVLVLVYLFWRKKRDGMLNEAKALAEAKTYSAESVETKPERKEIYVYEGKAELHNIHIAELSDVRYQREAMELP